MADEAKDTQDKTPQLETEITRLNTELESVRNQAARYRVARNTALRQAHALSAVVQAHKINFDPTAADTGGLAIEDGKVVGEFMYKAPEATQAAPASPPGDSPAPPVTLDDVKKMSASDIRNNWEAVQKAVASQGAN